MGTEERRGGCRDRCFARILVEMEGRVGYIADVSDLGFKGLFPEAFPFSLGAEYTMGVSFEEEAIGYFVVKARGCWCRLSGPSLEIGFELIAERMESEAKVNFEQIRSYYRGPNSPQLDCT